MPTITSLETILETHLKKLEHFNAYKRQIELHLSETQTTIDKCEEEIDSAKRLLRIFKQQ